MENWKELYTEIATKLSAIDGVKWVDLWHNQVGFMNEEHPFPAPALFISFRTTGVADTHKHVQNLTVQMDVHLFYETFSDTFVGSYNQGTALAFLDLLTKVNALLHASGGTHYSEMRHVGTTPVDTGTAHNLYRASYTCNVNLTNAYSAGEDMVDADGDPVEDSQWQGYQMG